MEDSCENFLPTLESSFRYSKFERYEPLSFVVVLLNFVREDSAPILTYGERSQVTDPAAPASTAKEGANIALQHECHFPEELMVATFLLLA